MVIQDNDPKIPPIRGHFNQLLSFGEVRASYFIRKLVDGKEGNTTTATANCNNPEDKMVYLPTTSGFRPMYYRYMQEQGYTVTVCETGAVSVFYVTARTMGRDCLTCRSPPTSAFGGGITHS